MAAIYLYFNAAVYGMFAVWCSIAPRTTSMSVGYLELSPSGMSEYLVVYGGLEYGIAFFFAYCARAGQIRTGLIFAHIAVFADGPVPGDQHCLSVAGNDNDRHRRVS